MHLIFDLKRIPIPGAMVMSHEDGRIAFVIPRPDFGSGVVVVGTTDGPSPPDPADVEVKSRGCRLSPGAVEPIFSGAEIKHFGYPQRLCRRSPADGGRRRFDSKPAKGFARASHRPRAGGRDGGCGRQVYDLSKDGRRSRRLHSCGVVSGRKCRKGSSTAGASSFARAAHTRDPMNAQATQEAMALARLHAAEKGVAIAPELLERYGANATLIQQWGSEDRGTEWPNGFPDLGAQLRFSIRHEMTMHLRDFYFRRLPLYASRADHGLAVGRKAFSHLGRRIGQGRERARGRARVA